MSLSYPARVAEAVNNEAWQKFRRTMKGQTTARKLEMLGVYYDAAASLATSDDDLEYVKIRIDNYIKALCRGGQLDPGMTFDHFSDGCIVNHIRK
jgi:hypothetical protein